MSFESTSLEITGWDQLWSYVQQFNGNNHHQIKICLIDEEGEEIRIESEEEFQSNVQYAKNHGMTSLKFLIYSNNLFKFDGIFRLDRLNESPTNDPAAFPVDKLELLKAKILPKRWFIPVKVDEDLGFCLQRSIEIIRNGHLPSNVHCQFFLDKIVPDALEKLQTSQAVFKWKDDIHQHIFDLLTLFVDLVAVRLQHSPIPVELLRALAISFDPNTTFSQKHKTDPLPNGRVFLGDQENFLQKSSDSTGETFLWIRALLAQFIAGNALRSLVEQFANIHRTDFRLAAEEYLSLLKLFSKSHPMIVAERYRALFTPIIRQTIDFLLEEKKHQRLSAESLNQLNEVLLEVCLNYDMTEEIHQLLQVPSSKPKPKPKHKDVYETVAEHVRDLTIDSKEKESKSSNKRKNRQEQQKSSNSASSKKDRPTTMNLQTYNRDDPDEILRFFAPMKAKVNQLYEDLQSATSAGNLRQVLKIEEKLKLLRPYSAQFIADENTPDGTVMKPGETFRKCWVLFNNGSMPWSDDQMELVCLTDTIEVLNRPVIPVVAPHQRAILSVDLKSPDQPGIYESKWILSNRHRTFGPMIWCSIEVVESDEKKDETRVETFELVEIPLPSCFDLSKPFLKSSESSFTVSRSNSLLNPSEQLINIDPEPSDIHSVSTFLDSMSSMESAAPILVPVRVPSVPPSPTTSEPPRTNPPLHFVDAVVTNIFSVAKQAGSTAKAIFNTLQAVDEVPMNHRRTFDDVFEHLDAASSANGNGGLMNEPMQILAEMGFDDRARNQRLLEENHHDLTKVIDILSCETNPTANSFIN